MSASEGIELQEQALTSEPEGQKEGDRESNGDQPKRGTRVVLPPCQVAVAQAPIQAYLRPAMWVPGVRNLHMARETWLMQGSLEESLERLLEGVDSIAKEKLLHVHKVDKTRHYVEIFCFTAECNWLDVVEVHLRAGEDQGTTIGEAVSFSSGLFPAWFPLAFLCNVCCFYAPFSGNGQNTQRLEDIRNSIQMEVTVTAETKCNCCPS